MQFALSPREDGEGAHCPTAAWAAALSAAARPAGLLPGCLLRKGNIIHQGDKAADERRVSEQLLLSGGWGSGGAGKRQKAHSEIKNDGAARG